MSICGGSGVGIEKREGRIESGQWSVVSGEK